MGWEWGGVSGSKEQVGPSSYEREHYGANSTALEYPSSGHTLTCPALGLLRSRAVFSLHLLILLSPGSLTEGGLRQHLMGALEGVGHQQGLDVSFLSFSI